MTSQRSGPDLVREWLDETYAAERDAGRFLDHVIDAVPTTPQRRRRWWDRVRSGRVETLSATDMTEYRANAIPATNGHRPTVIGRTHSMFSPVKAIAAGALAFAIGGVLLVAQPFDQRTTGVPGAATDEERAAPVEFTAKWAFGPSIRSGTSEAFANGVHERGGAWRPRVLVAGTDPRWEGTISVAQNSDDYGAIGGPSVGMFAFRIENEEGAWQQMPTVTLVVPGVDEVDRGVFVGEGAYEGLIAVVDIATDHAAQTWDLHGYIIDDELPPPPEPVVLE